MLWDAFVLNTVFILFCAEISLSLGLCALEAIEENKSPQFVIEAQNIKPADLS